MRRRELLLGALAASVGGLLSWPARAAGARKLVLYWAPGGWDPTMVLDPHFGDGVPADPGAEPASAGALQWASSPERPSVDAFFQEHQARTAILNGVEVGSMSHRQARRVLLTGSWDRSVPDFCTSVGAATSLPIPVVLVSGPNLPGTQRHRVQPLSPTLSQTLAGEQDRAALRSWLKQEGAELQGFEALLAHGQDLDPGDSWLEGVQAGVAALRDELSACMVVQGTSTGFVGFDTHVGNTMNQSVAWEGAFQELTALAEALGSQLDDTLVLAMSELGRAPQLTKAEGKEHWPVTSVLAFGAGVEPGVYGATDARLWPTHGIQADRLAAAIVAHLGLSSELTYPETEPFTDFLSS